MATVLVPINIPDGELCDGCDLWYRSKDGECYCLIFDMVKLSRRYKENKTIGTEIVKCKQCMSLSK